MLARHGVTCFRSSACAEMEQGATRQKRQFRRTLASDGCRHATAQFGVMDRQPLQHHLWRRYYVSVRPCRRQRHADQQARSVGRRRDRLNGQVAQHVVIALASQGQRNGLENLPAKLLCLVVSPGGIAPAATPLARSGQLHREHWINELRTIARRGMLSMLQLEYSHAAGGRPATIHAPMNIRRSHLSP